MVDVRLAMDKETPGLLRCPRELSLLSIRKLSPSSILSSSDTVYTLNSHTQEESVDAR